MTLGVHVVHHAGLVITYLVGMNMEDAHSLVAYLGRKEIKNGIIGS